MNKIRVVYFDIEGCLLPGKGLPFPLDELSELQDFFRNHGNIGFSICTGRSVSYVEAIIQTLDLINSPFPCVCEGGAILYWPASDKWEKLAPPIDINKINNYLSPDDYRIEPGKLSCLSLYPNPPKTVEDLYVTLLKSLTNSSVNLIKSMAAVDITPKGVDKGTGIIHVSERMNIPMENILCIGDAENDIPMLQLSGYSACPSNATENVKNIADYTSHSASTQGVIEILRHYDHFFVNQ